MKTKIVLLSIVLISTLLISFSVPEIRNGIRSKLNIKDSGSFQDHENGDDVNSARKTFGDVTFQIIPQPAEKRIYLSTGNMQPSEEEIKGADQLICYELRISHSAEGDVLDVNNGRDMEDKVNYFSHDLQRRIRLIVESDTIPSIMYHFERNYGIAPYTSIQLGFPCEKDWHRLKHHVIIHDDYFNVGEIHLVNSY